MLREVVWKDLAVGVAQRAPVAAEGSGWTKGKLPKAHAAMKSLVVVELKLCTKCPASDLPRKASDSPPPG